MAISATFKADFTSFTAAVKAAEVQLKEMESGAGRVQSSLDRMVKSFSGQQVIGQANLMVKALGDVEGVSKLTEAEQRRVNATLTEAIAKYHALGQSAPADMQRLADATKQAGTAIQQADRSTSGFAGGLSKINGSLGAFGVAVSVGAVVNFGKHVFDTASNIHDMAEKLGISTDAVQGFKFAAEQSGSSLDSVGTAINKMNVNIAGIEKASDPAAVALRDMGLNVNAIRAMKPEDAFLAITDAIQKIPDPMRQADDAMAVFGKGAADLLPGIKEGFRGLADSAQKMSEDTINSLEAAQDAWGKLADRITIMSGSIISSTMNAAERVTATWGRFAEFADNAMKFGVAVALTMADAQQRVANASKDVILPLAGVAAGTRKTKEELDAAAKAAEELQKRLDHLIGQDLIDKAKQLTSDIRLIGGASKLSAEMQKEANITIGAALDVYARMGKTAPQAMRDLYMATVPALAVMEGFGNATKIAGREIEIAIPKLSAFNQAILALAPTAQSTEAALAAFWKAATKTPQSDFGKLMGPSFLGSLQKDLSSGLGPAILSAFQGGGDTGKSIGGFLGGSIGKNILGDGKTGMAGWLTANLGKTLGGVFGSVIPGLGTMLGGLVGSLFGKLGGLFGNATKSSINEAFGSYDALRSKLNGLTGAARETGDALWIQLTQRTGKGDKGATAKLIEEINGLLGESEQKLKDVSAGVGEMVQSYLGASGQITPAMQAMIDMLVKSGKLTAENARELLGIGDATPGFEAVSAAAQTLGVNIETVGKNIQQMAFSSKVDEVSAALGVMKDAGADMDAVFTGSVEKIQPLVAQALKFGLSLPETMREPLKRMAELGLLTDDNGQKLLDLSGVNFAEPLSKKFDDLIVKLGELVDAILGPKGVAGALDSIGQKSITAHVRVKYDEEGFAPGEPAPGSRVQSFDIGTQGQYLDFGSGTLAMLHGRERVMREGEGGGIVNVNISAIDSRSVEDWLRRGGAEQIMRALPRAWVGAGL